MSKLMLAGAVIYIMSVMLTLAVFIIFLMFAVSPWLCGLFVPWTGLLFMFIALFNEARALK